MRIISQDGNWDIPYEQVAIVRAGTAIYFQNANLMGKEPCKADYCLGRYITEEDAIKTFESIYDAYSEETAVIKLGGYQYQIEVGK